MDVGLGNIMKAPIGGGTPTLVASGQEGAVAIAVGGTHVYWATSALFAPSTVSDPTSGLFEMPAGGGTPVTLTSNVGISPDFETDAQ